MKHLYPLLCTLLLTSILIGCQPNTIDSSMKQWEETANLNAQETPLDLYKQALLEDTLIVYSTTTRIYDVKESFETQYPGLTVEVYDTRAYDLVETLLDAHENNETICDIVICSDDNGSLTNDLLPKNIIYKYVPYDIEPFMFPEANTELLSFVGEAEQLFYNSSVYDIPPITNWWELTEPKWYGNVYMNSPLRSHPSYALVHSIISNSTAMESAYFAYYGEELNVPENSSAGEIFFERLVANGLHFTTSSNEIVEVIASTQENPPVGFMISSKIRRNELGLSVAVAYGANPCDGVYASNTISIAGGSKNVNSAKLFIRWLLGETDGTGKGLTPYLLEGTWPVRTDVNNPSAITLAEGNFWFNDKTHIINQTDHITQFWSTLQ
ncbi:MAG: hypothetical protein R3Y24_05935 [Eubacteriales bacterium]